MLSFLGENNRLPLFHMDKFFIWLEETKERINKFLIGYMMNPRLNIKKSFREKVFKFIYDKSGKINKPYIRATLAKKQQYC